ncbi:MAG: AMP-binding protein [Gammaproteobacteria bacterium]|nr:AMP-binding protein [Gammaproteobacteria bacterium]
MSEHRENIIYTDEAKTLHGLFHVRVKRSPDKIAYCQFNRNTDRWEEFTWREMADSVARWQAVLKKENLGIGDRVALSLKNGADWIAFEQASLGLGLVVIPLYTDDRADNIAYIIKDAAVKCLLLQDEARWKRIAPTIDEDTSLQHIYIQDGGDGISCDYCSVTALSEVLPHIPPPLTLNESDPHSLATVVYTSGTTGRPKGVMLSHNNILENVHVSLTMLAIYEDDIFLSFLPISHMLERMGGYYMPMMAGSKVSFSRSIPQLADDLAYIRPTIMVAVPRIFERIYGRIHGQLEKGKASKRVIFKMAIRVGWHKFEHSQGRRGWHPRLLVHSLLDKLVGAKVRERLGGRLRFAVSGGAALSPEVAKMFLGLGVDVLNGYGLTETSPVISCNIPSDNDPYSVGVILTNLETRISAQDELQVKGPNIMLGYWNNHAATAEMIDHEGWLSTGDLARIENGHIYITGRIKDILVLSNGEKVPPGDMELAIANDSLFEQVMVVGEGQSFLAALIVLNAEEWPAYAQQHGFDPMDAASLSSKKIIKPILIRIRGALHDFPSYAKIRQVYLTLDPWTIDNDLMTPTMKIKRPKVLEHLKEVVDEIYSDNKKG